MVALESRPDQAQQAHLGKLHLTKAPRCGVLTAVSHNAAKDKNCVASEPEMSDQFDDTPTHIHTRDLCVVSRAYDWIRVREGRMVEEIGRIRG